MLYIINYARGHTNQIVFCLIDGNMVRNCALLWQSSQSSSYSITHIKQDFAEDLVSLNHIQGLYTGNRIHVHSISIVVIVRPMHINNNAY